MKLPLPKRVHLTLRARLLDGSLPPGTRLDYKQLAVELGVSTTPIREAVTQLASEGFVELIPRLGAVVRSLTRNSAMEFYEVREAVETFAAMKAAERISPRHLEALRQHFAIMQQLFGETTARGSNQLTDGDLIAFLDADLAFHRTIVFAARNPALARTVEESHIQSRIFYADRGVHDTVRLARACKQHGNIFDALEKHDGIAAAEAMRAHIRSSLEATLDYLEADDNTMPGFAGLKS
ncbi:MAG: GntR family transcriptional regulator [Verrucomicrobiota bacterium]